MNRLFVMIAAASLAAVTACSNAAPTGTPADAAKGTTAAAATPGEDPSTVVATVNGEKITLADLDKPMTGKIRDMEQQMRDQKYKMRQAGLEAMVAQKLVQAEAKKRGITDEELLKQEVESKIATPTDEEVKAFYDKNAGMPGLPPFDQAKDRIREYLKADGQKKALIAYFDQLKAGAKVEITLAEPEAPVVEVAATGPAKGPEKAPVTIVTFSDFQCPFCGRAKATVDEVMKQYDGKVKLVFRDFPLPFHENAQKAAEAGQCAAEQGKFWEMHDKMFANQKALAVTDLKGYAKEVGVDTKKFDECLDSGKMADAVKKNQEAGEEAGVQGTPAFFVNGHVLSGALPFDDFKKVIDKELVKAGVAVNTPAPAAPAAPGAPAAPAAAEAAKTN